MAHIFLLFKFVCYRLNKLFFSNDQNKINLIFSINKFLQAHCFIYRFLDVGTHIHLH